MAIMPVMRKPNWEKTFPVFGGIVRWVAAATKLASMDHAGDDAGSGGTGFYVWKKILAAAVKIVIGAPMKPISSYAN